MQCSYDHAACKKTEQSVDIICVVSHILEVDSSRTLHKITEIKKMSQVLCV